MKEVYNLIFRDPAAMGWLELDEIDGKAVSEVFSVIPASDVSQFIRLNFCERCDNYDHCRGVQNISEEYNCLERVDSKGLTQRISSNCPLNGVRWKCEIGEEQDF